VPDRLVLKLGFLAGAVLGFLSMSSGSESPPFYPFKEVPTPLSGNNPVHPLLPTAVPVAGRTFQDLRFGTSLTRSTNGLSLRHEYSRFDPFNRGQSLIVLLDLKTGDWKVFKTRGGVYDRPGRFVRRLGIHGEPRWDPKDPSLIWGLRDFRIVKINAATGRLATVKDFAKDATIGPILKAEPDLYRITTKDEGETSRDKRFWALCLQGSKEDYRLRYMFCWDLKLNKILGLHKLTTAEAESIDWIGMSPLGTWVLIGGDFGSDPKWSGLQMADKSLTAFHKLAVATAHADVGVDLNGNEMIIMQNVRTDYVDYIPLSAKARPVEEPADYANNAVKRILRLYYNTSSPIGLNSGIHVSCNHDGYAVISTNTEEGAAEQNWLDRTITLVRLDPKKFRVYYLAKVYNTTGSYWEETQATVTNDGAKIVWASNWGRNVGQDQVFLMRLDMPAGWEQ
jgi:hypothetical protein